jgi:hypothetical protein
MKNLYNIKNELYIISNNEDINENSYIITQDSRLVKVSYLLSKDNQQGGNKVILTTNKLLIKDGVQPIEDYFLEWFVNNPSCEFVEVEKEMICQNCGLNNCDNLKCRGYENVLNYEIIIPQKEPKQETLEEAAIEYYNQFDTLPVVRFDAFKAGAKWQAERMYSEEEVESLLHKFMQSEKPNWHGYSTTKWFQQFKK